MTVTNVLRHRGRVTEATQQRVLQAIAELNYIPVRPVMQNRHITTNALGVVFLHSMQGAVGYPTFLGMLEQARAHDHDLNIVLRSKPDWVQPGVEVQFLDRRCDGYILVGEYRPELSSALVRHNIPVVECYSTTPPEGVASVAADNVQAMRLAVAHLVGLGHRRIAHIAGPQSVSEARVRRDAFCAAIREQLGQDGTEFIVQADSWGDLWGFDYLDDPGDVTRPLADAVLALDVTAAVCSNDLFALALWKRAEQRGLRVPEDISLIGMDNITETARKGLTTIAQPFHEIGVAAVDTLLSLIRGADSKAVSRLLPITLIERRSIAPAPKK
jgi:LacI family transcriptional regulator